MKVIWCFLLELWSDADAVNYIKSQWRLTLKQKMSVACFKNDGSDRIVGIDIMAVEQKDDVMYKLLDDVRNFLKNGVIFAQNIRDECLHIHISQF